MPTTQFVLNNQAEKVTWLVHITQPLLCHPNAGAMDDNEVAVAKARVGSIYAPYFMGSLLSKLSYLLLLMSIQCTSTKTNTEFSICLQFLRRSIVHWVASPL